MNGLTPEQRMDLECEQSLNQAMLYAQTFDTLINHLLRPAPRHIPTPEDLSDYDKYLAGEEHDERAESHRPSQNAGRVE